MLCPSTYHLHSSEMLCTSIHNISLYKGTATMTSIRSRGRILTQLWWSSASCFWGWVPLSNTLCSASGSLKQFVNPGCKTALKSILLLNCVAAPLKHCLFLSKYFKKIIYFNEAYRLGLQNPRIHTQLSLGNNSLIP